MNEILLRKSNLKQLEQIKKFMYCHEYKNLNIFSRQYYKEIILNKFNHYSKPYAFMFGDFDKLSTINNIFGKEAGDKALYNALKVIKYSLPQKAIISRVAGDEFSIILTECTKEQATYYKKIIDKNLYTYRNSTSGLTITFGIEDSKESPLVCKLSYNAEQKVNNIKSKRKVIENLNDVELNNINLDTNNSDKLWKNLNHSISSAIKNYVADLRLSDSFNYTAKDLKSESLFIIEELGTLIEHKKIIEIDLPHNVSYTQKLSKESANLLHNLLSNNEDFNSQLNNLSYKDLLNINSSSKELSNQLIRNPISQLYGKSYLNHFLVNKICNSASEYEAIYFSNVGVKTSNTAYGHDYTDKRLSTSANALKSHLSDISLFNNSNFTFDDLDNFLIDLGGGNYLAIVEKSQEISENEIKNIINSLNNSKEDILKFGYSINPNFQKSTPDIFNNSLEKLKVDCNKSKDKIKHKILTSSDSILAFDKEILQCVNQFLETIPNALNDINAKKRFLSNVFISLTNEASNYKGSSLDEKEDFSRD